MTLPIFSSGREAWLIGLVISTCSFLVLMIKFPSITSIMLFSASAISLTAVMLRKF